MTLPTINDIQAVEPILQNLFLGYMQAADRFVASRVFPTVPVQNDSGTYYIATKKYWMLDAMKNRAPGQGFARTGFGVESATFKTLQWALENPIPDEHRRNSQLPMDLETLAVNFLGQMNMIRMERAFGADFMKVSVWGTDDNNSTNDWDDTAIGDPVGDVGTAVDTISTNTGQEANTMVLGKIVHRAIVNHPDVIDRIKYTQAATSGNIEAALADLFGVDNYWVSRASYNSANEGQTFSGAAIIDDDCLVCSVVPNPGIFGVTAGKTFAWDGGGGMGTIDAYRDDGTKSDIVRAQAQWDQKAVATDLGYFFADVV